LSFWVEQLVGEDQRGELAERYRQGKIEVLGDEICPSGTLHHKSHMDWPGIEHGPFR